MRAFFDVEFIQGDGGPREFYSVGIVRDDGQELHRISSEADLSRAGWWFRKNVLKQCKNEPTFSLLSIRLAVQEMLEGVTTLYTRDGGHDGEVLAQIVDGLPPIFDLQKYWRALGEPPLPARPADAHQALSDARWHQKMHEALVTDSLQMHVVNVWHDALRTPKLKGNKKHKRARVLRERVEHAYFSIAA